MTQPGEVTSHSARLVPIGFDPSFSAYALQYIAGTGEIITGKGSSLALGTQPGGSDKRRLLHCLRAQQLNCYPSIDKLEGSPHRP